MFLFRAVDLGTTTNAYSNSAALLVQRMSEAEVEVYDIGASLFAATSRALNDSPFDPIVTVPWAKNLRWQTTGAPLPRAVVHFDRKEGHTVRFPSGEFVHVSADGTRGVQDSSLTELFERRLDQGLSKSMLPNNHLGVLVAWDGAGELVGAALPEARIVRDVSVGL